MLRLRVTFAHAEELRRTLQDELRRGVLLVKITPPEDLEFRAKLEVEIASPGGAIAIDSEVVSILPGVGVAVAFPPERMEEARGLLAATPAQPVGETVHEIVGGVLEPMPPSGPTAGAGGGPGGAGTAAGAPGGVSARATFAEKVQVALHGTRDDRAAILRDQNKQLHPFVLKAPGVSVEEIASWAANAQMSPEFLKAIADRKEWISRPAIAVALARNPKAPTDIAIKAVDYVPMEQLRQMAKGIGAAGHVVQAARKKILPK